MKQAITLAAFLLVTLFVFGQRPEFKGHEKFWKSGAEKHLKRLKKNDNNEWPGHLIQSSRNFSSASGLKSFQVNKQRLDSVIYQQWDGTAGQWRDGWKEEHSFDTNGNMTDYVGYQRDGVNGPWVADWKEEYAYDVNGNLTEYFEYDRDLTAGQWLVEWKKEYTWDANGNLTECLEYSRNENANQWVAEWKKEYTYDANGYRTQYLVYEQDFYTGQWVPARKEEYTRDGNGNMMKNTGYEWNANQWVAGWKEEYTYDASGNITLYLVYYQDGSTSQWLLNWKDEYSYDANGDMTQDIGYYRDVNTSQWVPRWKNEYAYNTAYSSLDLILPRYDDGAFPPFTHMLIDFVRSEWDEPNSRWVDFFKGIFHYTELNATAFSGMNDEEATIYPNPAAEFFHIRTPGNNRMVKFELYDMQGRQVIMKEVENTEVISIEGLNKGMYFYNLFIDGEKQSGKLMKE